MVLMLAVLYKIQERHDTFFKQNGTLVSLDVRDSATRFLVNVSLDVRDSATRFLVN
jgi:hypothetical protein